MKLILPFIIYQDGNLFIDTKESFKIGGAKFIGSKFITKENLRRKIKSGWILDSGGNYTELKALGKSNEWLRIIQFLWNFILSEYEMKNPRKITIGEFKSVLKQLPKVVAKKELASDLIIFINTFKNDDQVITKETLEQWPL